MKTHAVVEVSGKQYLVQKGQELFVENMNKDVDAELELPVLMAFDTEKTAVELGEPALKNTVKATVLENLKGDKIRVSKFKSKVRYRKTRGFRPQLTKIKITSI